MLVNQETHTNHGIQGGYVLSTLCGLADISTSGPMWKYKQKGRGEMNCFECIAAEGDG